MSSNNRYKIDTSGRLVDLLEHCATSSARPFHFFIAWGGVPTLVFSGFSEELWALKSSLNEQDWGLNDENPGSRWPKISLGAKNDDHKISVEQLKVLRAVCEEYSDALKDIRPLHIDVLRFSYFLCRSHERMLFSQQVALFKRSEASVTNDESRALVRDVLAPFYEDDLHAYLAKVNMPGHNISYYRDTHLEPSLVAPFGNSLAINSVIDKFVEAVNEVLPGTYSWFKPASRHMTIRALV
ncbi:MAG: hypothetical protein CMF25_02620 [Kangiellaceae bacterium]|jgi:hypothetical protein|nr:hypothetical protein [Kangiellaceae bacterium]|tara:strand:+ start:936 stop:1655 length:720 start_codon:yes stop_codon:yes gene_type:complete